MGAESTVGGKIRVMLVDNSTVFLRAATFFLEAYPEIEVITTSNSEEGAIAQAQRLQPQVILLDPTLASCDVVDFVSQLCFRFPLIPVIVLSLVDVDTFRQKVLGAGAAAFVSKVNARTELLAAIRTVIAADKSSSRERAERETVRWHELHSFAEGKGGYG